jgi:7-cyano-7-deazaguanine synthase in queuosine biosynthesis
LGIDTDIDMNKFKTAILATGGLDSTLLIYKAVEQGRNPQVITVDYGQLASKEEQDCLNYHINYLGLLPLVILPFTFGVGAKPGLFTEGYTLKKPILSDDLAVYEEGEMKYGEMFIQARNAFLCLVGLAYCSENKIDEMQVGFVNNQATWDKQRSAYHLWTNDSSPHFVDAINTLSLTGFSHYVRMRAPLLETRVDKKEVFEEATEKYSIDVKTRTYSCYFSPPCNSCLSCTTRNKLLEDKK